MYEELIVRDNCDLLVALLRHIRREWGKMQSIRYA
jgi:hypothetical protein